MSLPPEKISIKRRRGDEPVDTLVLERDTKRRFTDFYFQRVQDGLIDLAPKGAPTARSLLDNRASIPSVRATKPGDETRELSAYKAAQTAHQLCETPTTEARKLKATEITDQDARLGNISISTRRFHLTRDLSSALKPNQSSGIRKQKWSIRPPLPTFVERHQVDDTKPVTIDRIVRLSTPIDANSKNMETSPTAEQIISRTQIPTFKTHTSKQIKLGQSIRDDPSTWDLNSDLLADELASLAMEMDPECKPPDASSMKSSHPTSSSNGEVLHKQHYIGDDFVYETYIRVPIKKFDANVGFKAESGGVGFLIIDEEVDDLWQQYMNEDDDDEDWNDEDEDSNAEDNPRNDYPEDEVSSDDEFGRRLYKYRNHASDNEQDELF